MPRATVRRMLEPEITEPADSAARTVQERSGRQYPFEGACYSYMDKQENERCSEFGVVKVFFAVRGGNNLITVPDVWCGVCINKLGGVRPKSD